MKSSPLLALLFSVGACTPSVSFNGRTYPSPQAEIEAAQAMCAAALGPVEVREQPLVGGLRLVLPANATVARNGLIREGSPPQWMVDYLVAILVLELDCVRAAIQKRNIAQVLEVAYDTQALHQQASGDVPVVYLYLPEHRLAQWHFATAANPRQPLGWNPAIADVAERYEDFLAAIEGLVAAAD